MNFFSLRSPLRRKMVRGASEKLLAIALIKVLPDHQLVKRNKKKKEKKKEKGRVGKDRQTGIINYQWCSPESILTIRTCWYCKHRFPGI